MSAFIYGLVDPHEPNNIRYIGLATRSDRPRAHERESLVDTKTRKRSWIRSLLNAGRTYDVLVLEEFPIGTSRAVIDAAEISHIAEKRLAGHQLTNIAPGGSSPISTEETRRKISESWSAERREIASLAQKVRRSEQESAFTKCWKDPEFSKRQAEAVRAARQKPEVAAIYSSVELAIKKSNSLFETFSAGLSAEEIVANLRKRIKIYDRLIPTLDVGTIKLERFTALRANLSDKLASFGGSL